MKSQTVIVFIHGILESPSQFEDLSEIISHKYDVKMLLLPGHGKTGRDFAKSKMYEWKKYLSENLSFLRQKYENIIMVGHSMGCLLAVFEAIRDPDKIKGLFLMANPLSIYVNPRGLKNGFRIAYNMKKQNGPVNPFIKKHYSVSECQIWDYPMWIPRYNELFSESRRIREIIKNLSVPSVNIFSQKDEFVSINSIKYFAKVKNYKLILLKNSGHFYYTTYDRAIILNSFTSFLDNTLNT